MKDPEINSMELVSLCVLCALSEGNERAREKVCALKEAISKRSLTEALRHGGKLRDVKDPEINSMELVSLCVLCALSEGNERAREKVCALKEAISKRSLTEALRHGEDQGDVKDLEINSMELVSLCVLCALSEGQRSALPNERARETVCALERSSTQAISHGSRRTDRFACQFVGVWREPPNILFGCAKDAGETGKVKGFDTHGWFYLGALADRSMVMEQHRGVCRP